MKYVALTLCTVATALLALALAGIANQIGSGGRSFSPVQNALPLLSPQQVSDQVDVQSALQALDKLPSTRFLTSTGTNNASAKLAAQTPAALDGSIFAVPAQRQETAAAPRRARTAVASSPRSVQPLPLPNVSVVLDGGAGGKAVVNGHLVHVGDTVGDGLVVKSINVDVVTFASGNEVMEVRMPLNRLRVLGAFPGSNKGN